jgi:hypothetical protein
MSDNSNGELRKVVCHASGDRCHACDHYYGRAESCEFKPTATSSDGRLIEALECAKYAIENPDSNQAFAIMAIDHALNTATSSDELVKEIDDYFNLSFLGDHVSRMQQVAELLQKCRSALEAANE